MAYRKTAIRRARMTPPAISPPIESRKLFHMVTLMCSGSVSGGRESQKSSDRNDISLSSVKLYDVFEKDVAFGDRPHESVAERAQTERAITAVVAAVIVRRPLRHPFRTHQIRVARPEADRVDLPLATRRRRQAIVECRGRIAVVAGGGHGDVCRRLGRCT